MCYTLCYNILSHVRTPFPLPSYHTYSVSSNQDSICMLASPYPPASHPLHVPKSAKCPKSHAAKACKTHARALATCEAHAENQSSSDVPVHCACTAQSTCMSQSKLLQPKMHKTYLQVCSSRLYRNLASLLLM